MLKNLLNITVSNGLTPPEDMPVPTEFDFSYPGIFLLGYVLGILTVVVIMIAKRSNKNDKPTDKSKSENKDEEEHK